MLREPRQADRSVRPYQGAGEASAGIARRACQRPVESLSRRRQFRLQTSRGRRQGQYRRCGTRGRARCNRTLVSVRARDLGLRRDHEDADRPSFFLSSTDLSRKNGRGEEAVDAYRKCSMWRAIPSPRSSVAFRCCGWASPSVSRSRVSARPDPGNDLLFVPKILRSSRHLLACHSWPSAARPYGAARRPHRVRLMVRERTRSLPPPQAEDQKPCNSTFIPARPRRLLPPALARIVHHCHAAAGGWAKDVSPRVRLTLRSCHAVIMPCPQRYPIDLCPSGRCSHARPGTADVVFLASRALTTLAQIAGSSVVAQADGASFVTASIRPRGSRCYRRNFLGVLSLR